MNTTSFNYKLLLAILGIVGSLSFFAIAGEMKEGQSTAAPTNRIEIKDFHFSPETITVKPGPADHLD